MNNKKMIQLIVLAFLIAGGVYGLSQQYEQESSLGNTVHQHIQTAQIASINYLEKARAVQGKQGLSTMDSAFLELDQHLQTGERLVLLAKGENLLEQDPDNLEILLRLGVVYLQEEDYDLAEENLSIVHQASTTIAQQAESAWFLALLQAQQERWERSQQYLQEVLDTHTAYRREAEKLAAQIANRHQA